MLIFFILSTKSVETVALAKEGEVVLERYLAMMDTLTCCVHQIQITSRLFLEMTTPPSF